MNTRRYAPPRSTARSGRLAGALAVGLALAPLPAAAQFMALTPSPKPEAKNPSETKNPEPRTPLPPIARPAEHAFNGQLPNQRTGTGRQRAVRDICIGCDR